MPNFWAIDIESLTETTMLTMDDILVVETSVGTRDIILDTLYNALLTAYIDYYNDLYTGTPIPTTPPPTTPPTTPGPTTLPPTTTPTLYTLSLVSNPSGYGTSFTGAGSYAAGTHIPIDCVVAGGRAFVYWSGDITGGLVFSNQIKSNTFIMPAQNVNLVAQFPTPGIRNFVNGNETGPFNVSNGSSVTLSFIMQENAGGPGCSNVTMKLTKGVSIIQQWSFNSPIDINAFSDARSINWTVNAVGSDWALVTTATNVNGVGYASSVGFNVV